MMIAKIIEQTSSKHRNAEGDLNELVAAAQARRSRHGADHASDASRGSRIQVTCWIN